MKNKLLIDEQVILDLVYLARRYCDKRSTYAPFRFNKIYITLQSEFPDVFSSKDVYDSSLMNDGEFWPYAQDGSYDLFS